MGTVCSRSTNLLLCSIALGTALNSTSLYGDTRGSDRLARVIHTSGTTDFVDLQAAFDHAETLGGEVEIRLVGDTHEVGMIPSPLTLDLQEGDDFEVSGGWDPSFAVEGVGNARTTIWGPHAPPFLGSGGTGLAATVDSATLSISRIEVFGAGPVAPIGVGLPGGLSILAQGAAVVDLSFVTLNSNVAEPTDLLAASGAGLSVEAAGTSLVELEFLQIHNNVALGRPPPDKNEVRGGGAWLRAVFGGQIVMTKSDVGNNLCHGAVEVDVPLSGSLYGCNIHASADGSNASITLEDNGFITPTSTGFVGTNHDLNGHLICADHATFLEERNKWIGGFEDEQPVDQPAVHFRVTEGCKFHARGSVVAQAPQTGVRAFSQEVGWQAGQELYVGNYTIADNGGAGDPFGIIIQNQGDLADVVLANTVSFFNSGPFEHNIAPLESVTLLNNVSFENPLFSDLNNGDYSVMAGSPAINAGHPSPPGGLTEVDIEGDPRVFEGMVDAGAWEYQFPSGLLNFFNGFEPEDP